MNNLEHFMNAVSSSVNYHKEKLEYKYTDENGEEKASHVFIGIRKIVPASILTTYMEDDGKGFGKYDSYSMAAGVVLFIGDDGTTETKDHQWFKDMEQTVFLQIVNIISKYHGGKPAPKKAKTKGKTEDDLTK